MNRIFRQFRVGDMALNAENSQLGTQGSPDSFKHLVVKRQDGATITLADVADIRYAAAPPISAAQIMGKPGIVMMIIGQYGANTLSVSRQVESVLNGFKPLFEQQGVVFHTRLFRPADYIKTSVHQKPADKLKTAYPASPVIFRDLAQTPPPLLDPAACLPCRIWRWNQTTLR